MKKRALFIVFYSFWLLYLIRAPSDTIEKIIIFGLMVTGFMILTIKIPEWAIDQSSITKDDNSIQDISGHNTNREGIDEYMRDIPVVVDILFGISTLILGIIVTII